MVPPVPTVTFSKNYTLAIGNQTLKLDFPYLAIAKDVDGVIKAHDIALNNYDFDTFVGGHLTRLGTRNDAVVQREFVNDLENAATKANQEVLFSKVAQQVGRFDNLWLIFSKHIDAVNENCIQNMLLKWENKLGGAREFMSTHCFTMSEAERVDPTLQAQTQNSTFIYK